jgi:regulator of replication initiation timing
MLTKEELLKENTELNFKIEELEKKEEKLLNKIEEMKTEMKSLIDVKDKAISSEYDLRKLIDSNAQQNEFLKKENGNLQNGYNKLAQLFDETFTGLKDINILLNTFQRNSLHVIENLQNKIDIFNKPQDSKEGNE